MDMDLIVNISNPEPALLLINDTRGPNLSIAMAMPEAVLTSVLLSIVTVSTIVGNVLVILSVFTYKPLRIAQNFFLVSLAVADLTVAVLVMPFNMVHTLFQRWMFGLLLCEMWLTCDVLCCTASILNLCAIAMDRYWAIHDPINYAQKRTLRRVVFMIFVVWVVSGVICLPPLIGWNDWSHNFDEQSPCKLTSQKGYVIYSSCGSFFIPLMVMTTVYVKIYVATKRRLRERAKTSVVVTITRVQTSSTKFSKSMDKMLPLSAKETNHNDSVYMDEDTPQEESSNVTLAEQSVSEVLHLHKVDSKASENSPIHQFIEERQKISLSKERRAARILGIVMGVFVVCWLPFFAMYVVIPFCKGCSLSKKLENFITWLGYVNSALNPIIYTIFNMDFRRAFARLLQCNAS